MRPLYAEARGDELGVVPMKSEEYRLGYSFEALRDLKQVPLTSDQARNGYFLHESLERLFTLMNDGYGYVPSIRQEQLGLQVAEAASTYEILERGFSIAPLQSSLFDRRRTRLLSSVRFRNWVLQEVSASTSSAYKCFLARGWDVGARPGVVGFLHPDGIYNDPKGASLRAGAYPRLRAHFQLINELRLFAEVHHLTTYGVNIYSNSVGTNVVFDHISNLFHPSTIDASYAHDGHGQVPGIKNPEDDFNWDLRGHRRRIVRIDDDALALFARLHDEPGTPAREARLPVVHSTEIVGVLRKFAMQKRRLADLDHFSTVMFDDTYAQRDGTIRRETRFPAGPEDWILSGPHFYVATPFNKTPNEGCATNRDYSDTDLTEIPDDFLPRTNYVPACSPEEYRRRTATWKGRPVTEWYRHVHREMVPPTGERTFIGVLAPPTVGHVNTVFTVALEPAFLLQFAAMSAAIPTDFFMKGTGTGHNDTLASLTPVPQSDYSIFQAARVLRLNCITLLYADLWNQVYNPTFNADGFSRIDPRLTPWGGLPLRWNRTCALRTDFERRQALVELDALAALALGLTLEELLTIYRVQFPVLQKYEHENRYDQNGRLVPGEVLKIAKQEGIDINQPGPGIRWTDPKLYPVKEREYAPPFTRHDREVDMAQAYRVFQERLREKGAA